MSKVPLYGTHKIVKARFWPWLDCSSPLNVSIIEVIGQNLVSPKRSMWAAVACAYPCGITFHVERLLNVNILVMKFTTNALT